jgi:hypothetical protein
MARHSHRFVLAALALACAAPASAQAGFVPGPGSPFATGSDNGSDIAAGDLDKDGAQDLVVANSSDPGEVGVWHGNGSGGFTQGGGSPESTVKFPAAVRLADFNADGNLDAVTTHNIFSPLPNDGGRLLLHKGNPAGPTLTGILNTFTKGDAPQALDVADVNGDSKPDVVVANSTSPGSLAVHVKNAGAGFFPADSVPLGAVSPRSVLARDFDEDGRVDLAAGNENGTLSVMIQKPDGSFSEATGSPFSVGTTSLRAMVAADFTGDGNLDVAVASRMSPGKVALMAGDGGGHFSPAPSSPFDTGADNPRGLGTADLNADGKLDLAVTNAQLPGRISVLAGNGAGSFSPVAGSPFAAGAEGPGAVAIADFDGDAQPDLATSHLENAARLTVLLNADDAAVSVPSGLEFGTRAVHKPRELELQVRNTGAGRLRVDGVTIGGPDAARFERVGGDCTGRQVLTGATCSLSLRYTPGSLGSHEASLKLVSNVPGGGPAMALAGKGRRPKVSSLRVTPKRFQVGRKAKIRFRLAEAGKLTLRLEKRVRTRSGARRWRTTKIKLRRKGEAGANRVRFSGQTKRRRLDPGLHRVLVVSRDPAGNPSRVRRARFRIL